VPNIGVISDVLVSRSGAGHRLALSGDGHPPEAMEDRFDFQFKSCAFNDLELIREDLLVGRRGSKSDPAGTVARTRIQVRVKRSDLVRLSEVDSKVGKPGLQDLLGGLMAMEREVIADLVRGEHFIEQGLILGGLAQQLGLFTLLHRGLRLRWPPRNKHSLVPGRRFVRQRVPAVASFPAFRRSEDLDCWKIAVITRSITCEQGKVLDDSVRANVEIRQRRVPQASAAAV